MTFNRILTIAAGFLLLTLGSCSEPFEPKPATYSQLLTGKEKKSWTLVSFEVLDEGVASGPIPASNLFSNNCEADDQYVFYANGEKKFEYTNGATKCATSEPDILVTDTWTLTNANATLEFAFPLLGGVVPFTLKSLTSTSMTIEIYLDNFEGIDASYRFVFSSSTK